MSRMVLQHLASLQLLCKVVLMYLTLIRIQLPRLNAIKDNKGMLWGPDLGYYGIIGDRKCLSNFNYNYS